MKKRIIYILVSFGILFGGCNEWLDVDPKSQIKEDALFESEAGFRDALVGIYTIMARADGYGGNATMGIMDMFGQVYSDIPSTWQPALEYKYDNSSVEGKLDAMYKLNYNAIVNCNYLLKNVDQNREVLRDKVYRLVKGEAMALRAFLHFDLLRGWAVSYRAGADQPAIPYVDVVTNKPVAQLTVREVLGKVIAEADSARELLREVDPIGPAFDSYTELNYESDDFVEDDGFWLYRKSRLNYYGVTALLARMYLYQENKAKALECALEVIHSGKFTLLTEEILKKSTKSFSWNMDQHEYITGLYVYNLAEKRSRTWFDKDGTELYISDTRRGEVFGVPGVDIDWRNQNGFTIPSGQSKEYVNKYMTVDRIPLLKLAEMYLIAAESSGDYTWLQTLRNHRGYINYPLEPDCDLEEEIAGEYRKEFIAEGQLFYFYKRLNKPAIDFSVQDMNQATYVFPMPDNELEFGDIK